MQVDGLRPLCLEFGGKRLAGRVGHVPEGYGRALARQAPRAGFAYTLGGAGDDDRALGQSEMDGVAHGGDAW